MLVTKKYLGLLTRGLIVQLIFGVLSLSAQSNFFPLGIYNYDVCGEEHTVDQPNEMPLIDGLHVNYLYEMSYRAQPGMIDTRPTEFLTLDLIKNHLTFSPIKHKLNLQWLATET